MRIMRKVTVPLWAAAALAAGVVGLAATHAGAAGVRTTDETYPTAGLVGVASGQAARLNVSNVATSTCNAKVEFLSSRGIIINYRTVSIAPGASASLRYTPSSATMVRPQVVSVGGSCTAMMVSLEVLDARSGRTLLVSSVGDPIG